MRTDAKEITTNEAEQIYEQLELLFTTKPLIRRRAVRVHHHNRYKIAVM
jgi:hypothetical protein